MSRFPLITLNTSRLILRPLREDDACSLFTGWSDPAVTRYLPFSAIGSVEEARDRVARRMKGSMDGESIVLVLETRTTGEVIGDCALFNFNDQCQRAEIGFCLQRQHWGGGYMFEAARGLIDCAFATLGFRRIEADIDPRNHSSAKLLERLGFVREGILRERWLVADEVSDSAIYGLLRSDPQPTVFRTPTAVLA